jgi:hypothetical protein
MTGITWNWADARRGFTVAVPAVAIAAMANISVAIVFALGTLPAAMLGLPPTREARAKLIAAASQHRAAALLPALATPAFALGMNHPAPDGFKLAAMFRSGSAWTTLINLLWPLPDPANRPERTADEQGPPQVAGPQTVRTYAVLFATAAAVGIAVAYALDLSHPAWAGAAAVFIMRPDPHLLISRAMGRVCATVAGVLLAALLYRHGIGEIANSSSPSAR